MADLKKSAIGLLGSVESVNLNSVASTTLFTVPAGELAVISHVIIREVTADCALAQVTFGQSGAKTDFLGTQDIGENLTAAGKAMLLYPKDGDLYGSDTWDAASIADGDEEAKNVAVTGAEMGDFCIASMGVDVVALTLTATVTAANVVTAVLANNTGGAVDLASTTLRVRVLKLTPYPPAIVEYTAGELFVIDVTAAVGGACTCTVDVFGRLKTA